MPGYCSILGVEVVPNIASARRLAQLRVRRAAFAAVCTALLISKKRMYRRLASPFSESQQTKSPIFQYSENPPRACIVFIQRKKLSRACKHRCNSASRAIVFSSKPSLRRSSLLHEGNFRALKLRVFLGARTRCKPALCPSLNSSYLLPLLRKPDSVPHAHHARSAEQVAGSRFFPPPSAIGRSCVLVRQLDPDPNGAGTSRWP